MASNSSSALVIRFSLKPSFPLKLPIMMRFPVSCLVIVIFAAVSFAATPPSSSDVEQGFEKWCYENTKSNQAILKMKRSFENTTQIERCVMRYIDKADESMDWKALDGASKKQIINKYCRRVRTMTTSCFSDPLDTLAICTGDTKLREVRLLFRKMIASAIDTICRNDGSIIRELIPEDYEMCGDRFPEILLSCGVPLMKSSPLDLSCRRLKEFRTCVMENFEACGVDHLELPTGMMDAMLNEVRKANDCGCQAPQQEDFEIAPFK
ncbi:uncharacterized protein LOC129756204 [Uranotaenia lowii]|uniref:uncharacterized protein LOC129756204 n=1 Tax=Uranotaenia lowii TaxID=190385 RepID=UPI00247AC132|nr:uncharacterized protein LOC129756204 [Uranotaenia lowii]